MKATIDICYCFSYSPKRQHSILNSASGNVPSNSSNVKLWHLLSIKLLHFSTGFKKIIEESCFWNPEAMKALAISTKLWAKLLRLKWLTGMKEAYEKNIKNKWLMLLLKENTAPK